MMFRFLTVSLLALLTGCGSTAIRKAKVAKAEITWFAKAASQQAAHLEWSLSHHCTCTRGKFDSPQCKRAAATALVVKVRAPWHKAMSLFNAGLSPKRPPKTPPALPALSTLCPGGSQ